MGVRGRRCPLDLGVGRAWATVTDVVADAPRKELRLLRYRADLGAQGLGVQFAQVDTVERDLPFGRVVKTWNQRNQRALSGTRGADQRRHLAGVGGQRDVVQYGCVTPRVGLGFRLGSGPATVTKRHILEPNCALYRSQWVRTRWGLQVARFAKQFENTFGRAQRLLKLTVKPGQRAYCARYEERVEQKLHQLTGAQAAAHHQPPTDPKHHADSGKHSEHDT